MLRSIAQYVQYAQGSDLYSDDPQVEQKNIQHGLPTSYIAHLLIMDYSDSVTDKSLTKMNFQVKSNQIVTSPWRISRW